MMSSLRLMTPLVLAYHFQLCALIVVKPLMLGDGVSSRVSQNIKFSESGFGISRKLTTERTTHLYYDKRDSTSHADDSFPFFEDDDVFRNVTAQLGNDVYLHCRVNDLADKTVSWVRKRGQSFELLTFGHMTYSSEERYSLAYSDPNDWRLFVRSAQAKDSGVYECQVSSHPPLAQCTNLIILVPVVEIVDNEGRAVAERFYQRGSTIELSCAASEAPRPLSARLTWLHGSRPLNHDTTRGGISVKTEPVSGGILSRLFVAGAKRADAGVYSCVVGDARASVLVHVLTGEHADAMQYGSSSRNKLTIRIEFLLLSWIFIVFYVYLDFSYDLKFKER